PDAQGGADRAADAQRRGLDDGADPDGARLMALEPLRGSNPVPGVFYNRRNRTGRPGVEPVSAIHPPDRGTAMLQRTAALAAMLAGVLGLTAAGVGQPTGQTKPEDVAKVKKALQNVQEFVGPWNLEGTQKAGTRTEAWKEKVNWGWKFKGDDAWLAFESDKGKYYTRGDLRYLPDKKKYQLSMTPAGKSEAEVYEAEITTGAPQPHPTDPRPPPPSPPTL